MIRAMQRNHALVVATLSAVLLGIALWSWAPDLLWKHPQSAAGIATHLFLRTDGAWSMAAILLCGWFLGRRPKPGHDLNGNRILSATITCGACLIAAGSLSGHGHPWSADEYCTLWQATAFSTGTWHGTYPSPWDANPSAVGVFMHPVRGAEGWVMSGYLPGFSLLMTPFAMIGVPWLLNPLLTAAGALILDRIVCRLGACTPIDRAAALGLYLSSGQVLAASGTYYAMPAHLTGNLLWFLLFLRADAGCIRSVALLPILGGFLMLLHKPFHAIFVLPFGWRMITAWGWRRCAWMAIPYLASWAAMRGWNGLWLASGGGYESGMSRALSRGVHTESLLGLLQTISWQPAAALLALLSVGRWREMQHPMRALMIGCALALVLIAVRQDGQGHGWGSRYFHPFLGGLVICAWWCWRHGPSPAIGPRSAWLVHAVAISTALAMAKLAIVAITVAPYSRAAHAIRTRDADMVLLSGIEHWLAYDLRRNDPWLLQRPLVIDQEQLPDGFVLPTGRTVSFGPSDFDACGMLRIDGLPAPP